jgi:hypothetical protein
MILSNVELHRALEMMNLGPTSIILRPWMPITQLIVEEVKGIPRLNPSQFQGQSTPEGSAHYSGLHTNCTQVGSEVHFDFAPKGQSHVSPGQRPG